MKVVKWTILSIVVLVAVLIGAVGLIIATLDPNDYKDEIAAQVKETTGRELTLAGDINWSVFPWLGLSLGEASLSNAQGFGDQAFASLEQVEVHVALMPLFKKDVHAQEITVKGLTLNLEKNKAGKDNWSDLSQPSEKESKPKDNASESGKPEASGISVDIKGIKIENARLSYNDAQAGQKLEISPFNLRTDALKLGEPVNVVSDLKLDHNGLLIALDLAGKINANPETGQYKLSDFVVRQEFSGEQIPGGQQSGVLRMDVDANTSTQVIAIEKLSADLIGMSLQGKMQVAQFMDKPRYSGQLSSNTFNLRQLMEKLGQALPETSKSDALGSTSLSVDFNGDTQQVAVKPIVLKLDQSTLQGEAALKDFANQAITFDLSIDRLNLDHYLPETSEKAPAPATPDAPAGDKEPPTNDRIELPVEMIKSLNIDGTARVDTLTAQKLTFSQASVTLSANKGLVKIAPLSANAYQGNAKINASLDVRKKTPAYKADVDLGGVQSGDILKALFDDPYLSGIANFSANIATSGNTVSELKKGLNGSFKAKFSEGTIKGSNLSAKILDARNFVRKLEGKSMLENKVSDSTRFSIMTATGSIKNGILNNPDLSLVAPLFSARGNGKVNLGDDSLDYTLNLGRPPSEGKENYFIPLQIKGPFSDLKFKLAADEAAKKYAKDELDKKKAELKKKADAEKARLKKKAEEEKAKLKAEADAKLKEKQGELEEKLQKELEKGLQKLFK